MSSLTELKRLADETALAARVAADAYRAALRATCEFQPGDIIRSANGTLARVSGIKVGWDQNLGIIAVLQKKNGEFGQREAPMWHPEWKKITLYQRAVVTP